MNRQDWLDRTHVGDFRELLRQMQRDGVRVQTCVTSPPYFRLRNYLPDDHPDKTQEIGREDSPDAYVAHLVDAFSAVRDVLADDGTLWVVIGDTYAARRSRQAPSSQGGPKHSSAQGEAGGMSLTRSIKPKDLIGIPGPARRCSIRSWATAPPARLRSASNAISSAAN